MCCGPTTFSAATPGFPAPSKMMVLYYAKTVADTQRVFQQLHDNDMLLGWIDGLSAVVVLKIKIKVIVWAMTVVGTVPK
jgi:hypothetical protein